MAVRNLTRGVREAGQEHLQAGRLDFFPFFPEFIDVKAVTTSSSAYTVPANAKFIIFTYEPGANISVRRDATAVYPTGNITDGTGAMINPAQFDVSDCTTLNFIAKDTATVVSLAVYS